MEESHLSDLRNRLARELRRLAECENERLDVDGQLRSLHYQQRLKTNALTQERALDLARLHEAEERDLLLAASREEKMFDKLKERQRLRYLKDLDLRLQKETDEIAKNVFLQKKG